MRGNVSAGGSAEVIVPGMLDGRADRGGPVYEVQVCVGEGVGGCDIVELGDDKGDDLTVDGAVGEGVDDA